MAHLRRVSDGKGDSGSAVFAISLNKETGKLEYNQTDRPIVGALLQVGSVTARSYSDQDWWRTTFVEEILEEDLEKGYWKFKTENSEYEFWH